MSARTSATIQQTDHGGMMRAGMPPDGIALARDPDSGVEAIHASFSGHAYDLHRHDEWLVGVTDRGLRNFFCRGADALPRLAGAADRFHLARAFRVADGTSPHAWLVQMRLLLARHLLRAGQASARVAAECGFADQSHFGLERCSKPSPPMRPVSSASRCMGQRRTSIARRKVARCIRETAQPREIN